MMFRCFGKLVESSTLHMQPYSLCQKMNFSCVANLLSILQSDLTIVVWILGLRMNNFKQFLLSILEWDLTICQKTVCSHCLFPFVDRSGTNNFFRTWRNNWDQACEHILLLTCQQTSCNFIRVSVTACAFFRVYLNVIS